VGNPVTTDFGPGNTRPGSYPENEGGTETSTGTGTTFPEGNLDGYVWYPYTVWTPDLNTKAIVGLDDAQLIVNEEGGGSSLTSTGTDLDARPDSGRLELYNPTGSAIKLEGVSIRGKAVRQYPGYQHDAFVDYEDIEKNGERLFRFGNGYIVNTNQLKKLCDYFWKFARAKPKVYKMQIPYCAEWLQVGKWYEIQAGGVGQKEYIDSVCILVSKRREYNAKGIGFTECQFNEIYQNWVFDSTAEARYFSLGGQLSAGSVGNNRSVGSATYDRWADRLCDGTNDEVEIQDMLDMVSGLGGGVVRLLGGVFYVAATITIASNCTLLMDNCELESEGVNTILQFDADAEKAKIESGVLTNVETESYTKFLIDFNGSSGNIAEKVTGDFTKCAGINCDGNDNKIVTSKLSGGRASDLYTRGDEYPFNPNGEGNSIAVCALDEDRVVIAYNDVGSTGDLYAVVGTVSGDVISYGTAVEISTSHSAGSTDTAICRLGDNKFVIAYRQDAVDGYLGFACVCTVANDDEITAGTPSQYNGANTQHIDLAYLDDDKAIVFYRDTGGANYGEARVFTVSGTTPTWGAKTTINGASTYYCKVDALSSSAVIFAYQDTAGSYYAKVKAGTISGTTLTLGSETNVRSASCYYLTVKALSPTLAVVGWVNVDTAPDDGEARLIEISGTTTSTGGATSTTLPTDIPQNGSLVRIDQDHFGWVYQDDADSDHGTIAVGYAYGALLIEFQSTYEYYSAGQATSNAVVQLSAGKFFIAYRTNPVTDDGTGARIVEIVSRPTAINVNGDRNIVSNNTVLGIETYQMEQGINIEGDRNQVLGNTVDGDGVSGDDSIDIGIRIGYEATNTMVNSNISINCDLAVFSDDGTGTVLG
jgi:hypothetical protein